MAIARIEIKGGLESLCTPLGSRKGKDTLTVTIDRLYKTTEVGVGNLSVNFQNDSGVPNGNVGYSDAEKVYTALASALSVVEAHITKSTGGGFGVGSKDLTEIKTFLRTATKAREDYLENHPQKNDPKTNDFFGRDVRDFNYIGRQGEIHIYRHQSGEATPTFEVRISPEPKYGPDIFTIESTIILSGRGASEPFFRSSKVARITRRDMVSEELDREKAVLTYQTERAENFY